jgi:hypothetical protein
MNSHSPRLSHQQAEKTKTCTDSIEQQKVSKKVASQKLHLPLLIHIALNFSR